nr:hypothetical protein [Tanacetum cinerariifolium]
RKVKGLAQQMFDRANTEYSTLKILGEMDRYLRGLSTKRMSEVREHYKLKQSIIMVNPLPSNGVNLPEDEQVQPELIPALHGFAPAVLDIPNNNNGWIEEEPEEDPKIEKEEEEEMNIEDKMDDLEIIYPYEIEEDTSFDSEPKVEAEDEDGDEATVGTITRASYSVPPFSGTVYVGSGSSRKVFAPGPIGNNVDMQQRKMRGLMLEDKEDKDRLKEKLRVSQQEKEQIEQAFCQLIEWI